VFDGGYADTGAVANALAILWSVLRDDAATEVILQDFSKLAGL
jgi:hypothetical protein